MPDVDIVLGCESAGEALGEALPACCSSCHTDEEEYGYSLCYVPWSNGRYFDVCCAKYQEIRRVLEKEKKCP